MSYADGLAFSVVWCPIADKIRSSVTPKSSCPNPLLDGEFDTTVDEAEMFSFDYHP